MLGRSQSHNYTNVLIRGAHHAALDAIYRADTDRSCGVGDARHPPPPSRARPSRSAPRCPDRQHSRSPARSISKGFELCVELINQKGGLLGRQVELIVSDNRSDTETAISQYERLIKSTGRPCLRHLLLQADLPVSAIINKYNMVHAGAVGWLRCGSGCRASRTCSISSRTPPSCSARRSIMITERSFRRTSVRRPWPSCIGGFLRELDRRRPDRPQGRESRRRTCSSTSRRAISRKPASRWR